ncbi:MAG: hypothetical protein GY909_15415 [Oligoflexia bacterium]|nr:hypothetical protein [Oligoflexia bacterium]
MKKLITLLFLILMTSTIKAQDFDKPVNVGGLSVDLRFCGHYDKIAGIASAWSNVNFPVNGGAGVAWGAISTSNVILDFCSFLARMKNLSTSEKIFSSAEYLNKLTNNKFNEDLNFAREVWDIKDVFIDDNGKSRPLSQIATRRQSLKLNRFYKTATDYSDLRLGTNINTRTRAKLEADMAKISRVAYRRSLNAETMSCPKAPTNEDYGNIYEKEVIPQEENIEKYLAHVNFYNEALSAMAYRFTNGEKEHTDFLKELNRLQVKTFEYNIQVREASVETVKFKKKNLSNDASPTESRTEEYKETIKKKYQTFCGAKGNPNNLSGSCPLKTNGKLLPDFIAKWESKWKTWAFSQATSETRGLLDAPVEKKVEREFQDFSILCNKGEIREKHDFNSSDFRENVEKDYGECIENKKMAIKKSGSLLSFYATSLVQYTKKLKQARAHIWTFESYHLGYFRNVEQKEVSDEAGIYTQEEVKCAPVKNLAALNLKMAEAMALNTEINQMLVEQAFEQKVMMQAQREKEALLEKEATRRRKLEEERKRRSKVDYKDYVTFPELNRGF